MFPIPTDPIESEPVLETNDEGRFMLRNAVNDLDLGAYDERIVTWAQQTLDGPTLAVLASLIERAKTSR